MIEEQTGAVSAIASADLRQRAEKRLKKLPTDPGARAPEDVQHLLHELQVHQIELEMQNEELRRASAELEESRSSYRDLFDWAPVGYLLVTETGRIAQANLTAATLLGVERREMVKRPLTRLIAREDQDAYYLQRRKLFETGAPQVCELRMVREGQDTLWVRIHASLTRAGDEAPMCRMALIDISERKRAQDEERDQRMLADALRDTAAALNSTLGLDEVLDRIMSNIARVLPQHAASIMLVEDGMVSVARSHGFAEHGPTNPMGDWQAPVADISVLLQSARSGQSVIGSQACVSSTQDDVHATDWVRSHISVPVCTRNQVIAFLNLDSETPGFFKAEHAGHLQAFANQAGTAIQNARLYAAVQRLAIVDELTHLYNRRGLFELGIREVDRAHRYGRHLTALFLDADHFHNINDEYGYAIGDLALRALADVMHSSIRDIDVAGRYGGEEFVALLTETDLASAQVVAERLRGKVEALRVATERGELSLTASVGVAQLHTRSGEAGEPPRAERQTLADLIEQAGQALHTAKNAGRNRVAMADRWHTQT